jgi:hypothetical protein
MHFRLPKPLHGWREFAGEVGIIVIGVLIALGAEQMVENIHWHHQLKAERSALDSEVISNLDAVQGRMILEPCIRRRLRELARILNEDDPAKAPRLIAPVGIPVPVGGSKGAWNIAVASGAISHMPVEEQLAYSNAFANYQNWDEMRRDERAAWIHLNVFDRRSALSEANLAGLREAYSEAVAADARIAHVGPFIFRSANVGQHPHRGLTPDTLFKDAGYGGELCQPLTASRSESIASVRPVG